MKIKISTHEPCFGLVCFGSVVFIFLSVVYLSVLWIAWYRSGNYDDKAVHYYSAVRLYSNSGSSNIIDQTKSEWLAKLPADKRFRTDNRLSSYAVYPLPSSFLRIACEAYRSPGKAPWSIALPFRDAAFATFLLALCMVIFAAGRSWMTALIVMFSLVIASVSKWTPVDLVFHTANNWHFLTNVPRCSAVLVLTAAFVAYVHQRWLMMGIFLLLVFFWHAGSGAVWVPLAILAFLLSEFLLLGRQQLCWLVLLILVIFAFLAVPYVDERHSHVWYPLWGICLTVVFRSYLSREITRAALATVGFLYVTELVITILRIPTAQETLLTLVNNKLVLETAERLQGCRHIAAVALMVLSVVALSSVLQKILPIIKKFRYANAYAGIIGGFFILFYASSINRNELLAVLKHHDCPFFLEGRNPIHRLSITAETANSLDPRDEETFFASLGDFLLLSCPTKAGAGSPIETPKRMGEF